MDENAVGFVRDFVDAGKPVAAICHGPWMLVEADVVRGRTLTSFPSLQTDIRNEAANGSTARWSSTGDRHEPEPGRPAGVLPKIVEEVAEGGARANGLERRLVAERVRPGPVSGRGWRRDSNPRPPGPQPGALPTELPPPRAGTG